MGKLMAPSSSPSSGGVIKMKTGGEAAAGVGGSYKLVDQIGECGNGTGIVYIGYLFSSSHHTQQNHHHVDSNTVKSSAAAATNSSNTTGGHTAVGGGRNKSTPSSSSTIVAVKILPAVWKQDNKSNCSVAVDPAVVTIDEIQNEIRMLGGLRHENLLQLLHAFVENDNIALVTPLQDHGSVFDIISAKYPKGIPELLSCYILSDVLQAVAYLHSNFIIHRGIRCSHILLSSEGSGGRARLAGLRNALTHNVRPTTKQHDYSPALAKSLPWLAPEVLSQDLRGYSFASDVYSLGVTGCEMGNGLPFPCYQTRIIDPDNENNNGGAIVDSNLVENELVEMFVGKLTGQAVPYLSDKRSQSSVDVIKDIEVSKRKFTKSFHQFVQCSTNQNPDLRPTANELQVHSFFKQRKKGGKAKTLNGILADAQLPTIHISEKKVQSEKKESDHNGIPTESSKRSSGNDGDAPTPSFKNTLQPDSGVRPTWSF